MVECDSTWKWVFEVCGSEGHILEVLMGRGIRIARRLRVDGEPLDDVDEMDGFFNGNFTKWNGWAIERRDGERKARLSLASPLTFSYQPLKTRRVRTIIPASSKSTPCT